MHRVRPNREQVNATKSYNTGMQGDSPGAQAGSKVNQWDKGFTVMHIYGNQLKNMPA